MENGLEISSRKFEEIDKICLLEFIDDDEKLLLIGNDNKDDKTKLKIIIWDLYNTDEVKIIELNNKNLTMQNLGTRLARTSGNLLQVDDTGKVTSILKTIEIELKNKNNGNNLKNINLEIYNPEIEREPSDEKKIVKENHSIYFYKKYDKYFKPVIERTEPWVIDDYEEFSFYLCDDDIEALQLIVGRTTVQIWHKILSDPKDKNKEKENLPNEGKSFLEFIWTNGIPVNQENHENRLRIKRVQFGLKYFHLEVYWYEKDLTNEKKEMSKYEEKEKMYNMEEIEGMAIKKRTIKWNDINESVNGVRYACKALEHLNKRAKSLINYDRRHKVSCY